MKFKKEVMLDEELYFIRKIDSGILMGRKEYIMVCKYMHYLEVGSSLIAWRKSSI